jgi:hypothetical protein
MADMRRDDEPITHLVIARACDADPEGAFAQAKLGHTTEPTEHGITEIRKGITDMFRASFGREPQRVGVAVLPWVGDLDEDEDEDDA